MNHITGIITTLNEEHNIVECIRSLQLICNEIIVVDSLSQDNTVNLALQEGAIVIEQKYLGDGIQKNFALDHASNDWIFSLDADERITPELAQTINSLNLNTPYDSFAVRRRNHIGSRWIKQCRWYPDYCIRLYNKNRTRFCPSKQHAYVEGKKVCYLKNDILHYSFKNIGELFGKAERNYSTRSAKIMYLQGKKISSCAPFAHCLSAFFTKYILHKGFMGGIDGLSIAVSVACTTYQKYAKLLEYQRDPQVRNAEDFNNVW